MIKLTQAFESFLNDKGFQLRETKMEGRIQMYSNHNFTLRIGEDYNGFTSIDIKRIGDEYSWIQITILRSYILKNEDYLKPLPFGANMSFIVEFFDSYIQPLLIESYSATLSALDKLKEHRANVLFRS